MASVEGYGFDIRYILFGKALIYAGGKCQDFRWLFGLFNNKVYPGMVFYFDWRNRLENAFFVYCFNSSVHILFSFAAKDSIMKRSVQPFWRILFSPHLCGEI